MATKKKSVKRRAAARTKRPAARTKKPGTRTKRTAKTVGAARSRPRAASAKRSTGTARSAADAKPPKPSVNAELIVRQGFIIDATAGKQHAVPEVLMLANHDGLQYLADVFGHLAHCAKRHARSSEPSDGVHIDRLGDPVNVRLSDALEFRLIPLTDANRAATFRRHGITMKSREHGSLFERYTDVAADQFSKDVRRLKRDLR